MLVGAKRSHQQRSAITIRDTPKAGRYFRFRKFSGRDILSGDEALSYKFFRPSLIVPTLTFDYTHNVNNAFSITSLLRRRHSDASAVRAMEAARDFEAGVTQRLVNGSALIRKPPEPVPSLATPAFDGSPKLRHSPWLKIRGRGAPMQWC